MTGNDIAALPPVDRARRAAELINDARAEQGRLADIRAGALAELRDAGWTLERIADEFGITPQAVSKALGGRRLADAELIDAGCHLLLDYAEISAGALKTLTDALRTRNVAMKALRLTAAATGAVWDRDDLPEEDRARLLSALARAQEIREKLAAK